MKFQIVSDSSCDLSEEFAEKSQITLVSFYVSFDGNTYEKEGKNFRYLSSIRKWPKIPISFPKPLCRQSRIIWMRFFLSYRNRFPFCASV